MAAGLGFKTFTTGEVLSAGDTNGYLMQGVLVFASAAARDAAITSPQEGQFAYLKDTNATVFYTGSAWTALGGGGKVLQVINATTSTQTDTTSSTYADTTLTATITPTLNTSKVLVFVSQNGIYKGVTDPYGGIKLLRGATLLVQMDTYSTISNNGVTSINVSSSSTTYLDSPATTSATTYKTQFNNGANTGTFRVQHGATSTITLMEIGA